MSDDDDIPVLTRVVRRERRAHPTLTPELRDAVVASVTARCRDTVADLVQAVAVDIDMLLRERVMAEIVESLPDLVQAALDEALERAAADEAGRDG